MSSKLDYYFWMNSDWALLGADRLDAICRRHGIGVNYKPVDLPQVYARTGGVLLSHRAPERQAYRVVELRRWSRKLGIEINPQPAFMCPNADLASKIVIAADQLGRNVHAVYTSILRAQWCEEKDISCPVTLGQLLKALGVDGLGLLDAAGDPSVGSAYAEFTEEAIGVGVFGSPSYVFQGELFWGQDRLEMLEEAIAS